MRRCGLPFIALAAAFAAPADAQTRGEIARCRVIEDAGRRLECYDAINLAPTAASKYEAVALDELAAYALSYRGRFVEVTGAFGPGEEFFFLRPGAAGGRPIPVDLSGLSRQRLEAVRSQCGAGCEATVRGRVGPVNFVTGVAADDVIVH